jgi:hypothetical protein
MVREPDSFPDVLGLSRCLSNYGVAALPALSL